MKIAIVLFVLFGLIGNIQPVEAQFWKKLGKRVEEAAKETVIRKVEDKTVDKTEKTMDTILNSDKKLKRKKKRKASNATNKETVLTRQNFDFTHKYVMQMVDYKNRKIDFEYYLKNDVNYIAVNMLNMNSNMISIMDLDQGKMIMLMENGDDKTQMTTKFDFKNTIEEVNEDISITKTENTKVLLGYTCYEYKVIGNDFKSNVWVTNEAGISFPNDFQGNSGKKMKNQNNNWMFKMDGMVLEMTITDTSKKKPRVSKMICTKLESQIKNIDTSLYKKMF